MEIQEKYWIAAVIDSEGTLSINKWGSPQLKVVNTNMDFLVRTKTIIGGKIFPSYNKPNPKHKPAYKVIVSRKDEIQKILSELQDILIIKKRRAKVMLLLLNKEAKVRYSLWKFFLERGAK